MALPTFSPVHQPALGGFGVDSTPRTIKNRYGDGYIAEMPDGLNPLDQTVQMVWNQLPITECQAYVNFFEASMGVLPFYYTLPRETVPKKWVCTKWRRTHPAGGYDALTATFERRYTNSV